MKQFLNRLFLALIPIIAINLIAAGTLIYLSNREDLTYVSYASALDKEQRLQNLEGQPRLVIIGGSNTRFSFNSKMLQDSLGIATVNMGIHIGLGLDFMFNQVENHLKQGDILLVSAEYQHYIDENTYYGDEGLTDMYLVKKEWGKAFQHIIDTHNFLSVYRLIRERINRNSMKAEPYQKGWKYAPNITNMETTQATTTYHQVIGQTNISVWIHGHKFPIL